MNTFFMIMTDPKVVDLLKFLNTRCSETTTTNTGQSIARSRLVLPVVFIFGDFQVTEKSPKRKMGGMKKKKKNYLDQSKKTLYSVDNSK